MRSFHTSTENIQFDLQHIKKKNHNKIPDNIIFCVHCDESLRCSLTNLQLIEPVVASDGKLYEKCKFLQWVNRQASHLTPHKLLNQETVIYNPLGQPLEIIQANKRYVPIRFAYKKKIRSLINPNKKILFQSLDTPRYLVTVVRNQDDPNTDILCIESIQCCKTNAESLYVHGSLDTYQFKKSKHESEFTTIDHYQLVNEHYSSATQYTVLVDKFEITPDKVEAYSFLCYKQHIDKITEKIKLDCTSIQQGKLKYHTKQFFCSSSFPQSSCVRRLNATSWTTSVMQYANLLKTRQPVYDTNYKLHLTKIPINTTHKNLLSFSSPFMENKPLESPSIKSTSCTIL